MQAAVVAVDDGTVPGLTPQEKRETLERWARYNLDRYYELVEDLTFPTAFLPLSLDDARLLIKGKLPDDLQSDLEAAIQRVGGESGAFVRLSTRSPKDAVDKMPDRLAPFLDAALKNVAEDDANGTLIALRSAFAQTLRISSAEEAAFIMSLSARTVSDVIRASSHPDGAEFWDMQLVVRKFFKLPPHGEFRAFVHRGRVTAISQYDKICYFPHLAQHRDTIRRLIVDFQQRLHQRISNLFEDYILDLVLFDDDPLASEPQPNEVLLVEINPWDTHTGSALFDWEKDRAILEAADGAEGEAEVRVVEKDQKPVFSSWQPLIDAARARLRSDGRTSPSATRSSSSSSSKAEKCILS